MVQLGIRIFKSPPDSSNMQLNLRTIMNSDFRQNQDDLLCICSCVWAAPVAIKLADLLLKLVPRWLELVYGKGVLVHL